MKGWVGTKRDTVDTVASDLGSVGKGRGGHKNVSLWQEGQGRRVGCGGAGKGTTAAAWTAEQLISEGKHVGGGISLGHGGNWYMDCHRVAEGRWRLRLGQRTFKIYRHPSLKLLISLRKWKELFENIFKQGQSCCFLTVLFKIFALVSQKRTVVFKI